MTLKSVVDHVFLVIQVLTVFSTGATLTPSEENVACTAEQHRPRYHFSPKKNWINDPNGLVYYNGVYHLYYQYDPDSMIHGPMHWGHATSSNMVIWEEEKIALVPDHLGTVFSGSSVVDYMNTTGFKESEDGIDPIVAIYTNDKNGEEKQSIAYSLDSGFTFTKYENNPVLNSSETKDFRDPKVMFQDDQWIMSLAVSDRIEFYSSPDLKTWKKESEIGRNPIIGNHDGVWECPDLISFDIEIDNKRETLFVLFVSINPGAPNGGSGTQYFIGNFTKDDTGNLHFNAFPWSNKQWLDWGPDNYAGVTFSNEPQNRKIYIGWMSNWLYSEVTPNVAHRGQMTIPRQLGLRALKTDTYRLTSRPVPELAETLRNSLQYVEGNDSFSIPPQTVVELTDQANFQTPLMELEIDLEMKDNPQFSICAYNNLEEEVCFGYNSTNWFLDRSKSGNTDFHDSFRNHPRAFAPREIQDELTSIRIFLDVSSFEVFADDGLSTMTSLHFPAQPFHKFYINHWSKETSLSSVVVKNFKLWGLHCWFNENGNVTAT